MPKKEVERAKKVSERSERALRKTRILAMDLREMENIHNGYIHY